jgi:TonB-linked SusC/RagA family outer membrane protein
MRLSTLGLLAAGGLLLAPAPRALAQATAQPTARTAQPLTRALADIRRLYGTEFVFEERLLAGKTTAVQVARGRSVEELLKAILYPNGLLFLYVDKNHYTIVARDARAEAASPSPAVGAADPAQSRTISGYVQDEKGEALPGATVLVGTSGQVGVATNAQGKFTLAIPANALAMKVSSIGYATQDILITADKFYAITLQTLSTGLAEVQVVSNGYSELPRERATGAFGVVTSEQLEAIPVPNVVQRLEGQVAGVQLNIQSSDNSFLFRNSAVNPTANNVGTNDYSLAVRGQSSLGDPGAQRPLIVLDGLPTELDLRTLNPDDIAQITVLKDAAAASIWGARAANGVLVIQTKKGRFNRAPSLSFSTSFTMAGRPRVNTLPLLNSAQLIDYERELVDQGQLTDPGLPPANPATPYFPRAISEAQEWLFRAQRGTATVAQRDSALGVLASRGRTGYDQLRQYLLQPAQSQTYDLSLSGGGENNTYFLSGSYAKERTNATGSDGSRLTLTANQEYKFFHRLTLTANAKGSFFAQQQNGLGLSPLATSPSELLPYNQLVDANGQSVDYNYAFYGPKLDQLEARGYLPWRYNYLRQNSLNNSQLRENNYWGALSLSAPLYGGLSGSVTYSMERTFGETPTYYAPDSYTARDRENTATSISPTTGQLVYGIPLGGILNRGTYGRNNYTLRGQLTFDRNFGGKHQVNALAGSEIREVNASNTTATLYGYNDQTQISQPVNSVLPYTTVAGINQSIGSVNTQADRRNRYLSYFANGSYTLLERYTASASVRYDDYNNLGLDRRYRARPFYSAGLAWTLTQEAWLKSASWLSNLRLRATYGLNGNIPAGAVPYTSISLLPNNTLTNQGYAQINSPANGTLRWETTAVTNLGVDFGLWGGRLSGTVEAYYKRGTDLFVEYPANTTYGYARLSRNAANLNGKGVDLTLSGSPVRTANWEWNLTGVASYNTNQVVDYQIDNTATLLASGTTGPINNRPTDYLLVFRSAGLDANGRTQVYNRNEGVVPYNQALTSLDDLTYAGRKAPLYTGGLTQTLRYKGLSLYVQTVFKLGYVFLPPTFLPLNTSRGIDLNADIDRRWRQPGDEASTSVPGVLGSTGTSWVRYNYSDARVQRGDHIRLREVALRYAVPASLLGFGAAKPFVKSLNLSVAARNLGLLWRKNTLGLDPDFLYVPTLPVLPPAVSYVFSLNAAF